MENIEVNKIVISSIKKGSEIYNKILTQDGFRHFSIQINCSELVEKEPEKKRKHDLPESLKTSFFSQFNSFVELINEKSCLYFFEFNQNQVTEVLEAYKKFGDNERNKSGLKSNPDLDTSILYVGKVKNNLGARLATHFGYAHAKTGGLQLRFWAKDLNLTLKVHLVVFNEKTDDYINPLELELTKILRPLIGKSK